VTPSAYCAGRARFGLTWVFCAFGLLAGCATQDDARVQSLLNQRGFGERYVGDANEQYYLGIRDSIVVTDPGHPELNGAFLVRMDGVIDVPMIGEIFVSGLTLPDVAETLTRRFQEFITSAQVEVQLGASRSKFYYVQGEVRQPGIVPFEGGTSLFQVVFRSSPSILADEDDVRLIRADPVNPLTVSFDYDDMLVGGWSRGNVEVRENDIIYVPPNALGYVAIFLEGLLAPMQRVFVGIITASRLASVTESFGSANLGRGGRRNGGRFGGFGFGGEYGAETFASPDGMKRED